MGISDVKAKETSDPDTETNLALEIGIKREPGAVVDHNKVRILVFLYDIVNDKDIRLTDADVSNEWLTSKHDWSDTNPEVLLVRYVRAKTGGALSESSLSEAAAKVRPGQKSRGSKNSADSGQRKYLGYIVRVYYDDELQAEQARRGRSDERGVDGSRRRGDLLQQGEVFRRMVELVVADQEAERLPGRGERLRLRPPKKDLPSHGSQFPLAHVQHANLDVLPGPLLH